MADDFTIGFSQGYQSVAHAHRLVVNDRVTPVSQAATVLAEREPVAETVDGRLRTQFTAAGRLANTYV